MVIFSMVREMEPSPFTKYQIPNLQKLKSGFFVSKNSVEKNREREKEDYGGDMRLGEKIRRLGQIPK